MKPFSTFNDELADGCNKRRSPPLQDIPSPHAASPPLHLPYYHRRPRPHPVHVRVPSREDTSNRISLSPFGPEQPRKREWDDCVDGDGDGDGNDTSNSTRTSNAISSTSNRSNNNSSNRNRNSNRSNNNNNNEEGGSDALDEAVAGFEASALEVLSAARRVKRRLEDEKDRNARENELDKPLLKICKEQVLKRLQPLVLELFEREAEHEEMEADLERTQQEAAAASQLSFFNNRNTNNSIGSDRAGHATPHHLTTSQPKSSKIPGKRGEMCDLDTSNRGKMRLCVGGDDFELDVGAAEQASRFFRALVGHQQLLHPLRRNNQDRPPIFIDRDPYFFGLIADFIEMGLAAVEGRISQLTRHERLELLEESSFYRLPELSGAAANPPVGAAAQVKLSAKQVFECGMHKLVGHNTLNRFSDDNAIVVWGIVTGYQHREPPSGVTEVNFTTRREGIWTLEVENEYTVQVGPSAFCELNM
eukprot:CAMPEP_0206427724 /NCGR_PEP_ID=MMETSP0324_2-20121206/5215_1 /ASSEMBLY_ACC=CAM_ASM_000836 /TAXON_ID=2866 /ORGANISM="Crypthecodinium cohnii, Strain Seligo" /LENGTH=474 /DNA_ID=CAMNT_0053893067 /DNA_START=335 /DNA_END=1759 /DNA_ORIENTATION=+